jgi:hypothetical protein
MRTGRRRTEQILLAAAAGLAVVVPALASIDAHPPGRLLLSVLFMLLVPGVPVVILLRLPDPLVAVALAIATSLAAALLLSTALLVGGRWSAAAVSWLLAELTLVLLWPAWAATRAAIVRGSATAAEPRTRWPVLTRQALPGRIAAAAPRLLPLCALAIAFELWCYAVHVLDLNRMGPAGAIDVVGWPYVASLLLIAAVAGWTLRDRDPDPVVMTAVVVTLVVVAFGLLNAADSAPGFRTAWVHVGFVDHISRYGEAATGFDARFSWPGFFAATAVLVDLGGLPDAVPLIRWAPVVFDLLAVPALLVIGRCVTGTRRGAWVGVLLYCCLNWYSQDYLSPQATVLLLYVATIATLLISSDPGDGDDAQPWWRSALSRIGAVPPRPAWLSGPKALVIEGLVAFVAVAVVVSHQLTPVALIGILFAFALTGVSRYRLLWLFAAVTFVGWFDFGAEDFWRGHLSYVFGDVGKLGSTLGSSVGARLKGNDVHERMQHLRLLWAAGSLLLAAVGLWLQRRNPRVLLFAALAFGPFGLLAVQSYGGEVALRCFVYGLPAIAALGAVVVVRVFDALPENALLRAGVMGLAVFLAAGVLTATRGANAGFERVTSTQVATARTLLDAMPAGSRIGLLADAGPLGLERLTDYESVSLGPDVCGQDIVACTVREDPDYVFVTSTMDVAGQLQFGQPPGWTTRTVEQLIAQHRYRRLASAPDAMVLGRLPRPL